MNSRGPRPVALFILFVVLFMAGLGASSLWDVDETRNARAAEEMMLRGDYVVPTVNGEVRAHKPPLHYWFMILAYKVFGVSEFSARFFAALFGAATVLLTAMAGSLVLGGPVGGLSGLILGVSFLFTVASRSATTDAFLVFFTNAAVLAGFFGSKKKGWAVLAWVFMGFAVLAKGPVGVVLPLGALVLFRFMDSRHEKGSFGVRRGRVRSVASLFSPLGILLFLAIALPWYLLAGARTGGDLVSGFILKHNVGRFLEPMESHGGPFFYYLPILLAGFFPWAAFLPQALAAGFRSPRFTGRFPGFLRLQVIWAAVVLLFFSASGTKLPNYILPCFPALALLTAYWVEGADPYPKVGFGGRTVSWVVNLLPALLFPLFLWWALKERWPPFIPLFWFALPMAAAALLGLFLHFKKVPLSRSFRMVAFTAALGVFSIHVLLLPRLEPLRMAPRLGRGIIQRAQGGDRVATSGYNKPALYFYGKLPVVRAGDEESLRSFLVSPGGRFFVTTSDRFERLPEDLKGGLRIFLQGLDALDTNKVVLAAERIDGFFQNQDPMLQGEDPVEDVQPRD